MAITARLNPSSDTTPVNHAPSNRPVSRGLAGSTSVIREPAHLPLHRRLLFPTYPLDKPLPVLVPGDGPDAAILNERVHILIALSFRAYILSWLPRITRDRSLLPHIHQTILSPILHPIFTRIHDDPTSLTPLLLLDLPCILTLHIRTYWSSREATSLPLPPKSLDAAYHARLPLPSTEPAGPSIPEPDRNPIPTGQYVLSDIWLTSLSDAMIRLHLPPEEYAVAAERIMIRELLGRTIFGGVGRRITEAWFWWGLILKLLGHRGMSRPVHKVRHPVTVSDKIFERGRQVCLVVLGLWTFGTWTMAMLSAAPRLPRYRNCSEPWLALGREVLGIDGRFGSRPKRWTGRLVWGTIELIVGLFSPILDRLLPYLTQTYFLTPQTALILVDLLESILFPLDGYPAPTPSDPPPEEAAAMRRELEERLGQILPGAFRTMFLPTHKELKALLDPISDSGCNAHLVGMICAAVVGAVIPELVVGELAVADEDVASGTEVEDDENPEDDDDAKRSVDGLLWKQVEE